MTSKIRFPVISALIAIVAVIHSGYAPLQVNEPTRLGKFFAKSKIASPANDDTPADQNSSAMPATDRGTTLDQNSGKYSQAIARLNETAEEAANAKALAHRNDQMLDQLSQARSIEKQRLEAKRQEMTRYEIARQQAYEQGRFDAMQATYQQPMSRTYSTPPHPQALFNPNYPANNYPANNYPPNNYAPNNLPYQGRMPYEEPMAYPEQMAYPDQMPYTDQQQRGYGAGPQVGTAPDLNPPSSLPSELPTPSISPESFEQRPQEFETRSPVPLQQPVSDSEGSIRSTGHFTNGVTMSGSELRHQAKTATEIALDLEDENAQLRQQLKLRDARVEQLLGQIKTQDQTIVDTQEVLAKSNRLAALLREKIGKLNVSIQDLEKEKIAIEVNADKTLRDIESTLDSVLSNSISDK